MKKLIKWVAIIFVVLVVIGAVFGPSEGSKQNSASADGKAATAAASDPASAAEPNETAADSSSANPEVNSNFTVPQQNAVRSAKQYLSMQGFSRKGLIQQLSSDAGDGYSVADATVAVDSLNVDWNQEAERSAAQYLKMQGFSCKGLVQQLSSSAGDGYTISQARHGAKQAGVC